MEIWKYELGPSKVVKISMPENSTPICVQMQRDTPCMWVEVEPDNPKVVETFQIVGTGQKFYRTTGMKYIGTFQVRNVYVFHVYHLRERRSSNGD